ncbi:Rik-like protein [Thalictrum thalictroides]|uniref:Protein RIK n=1 Tax=Thalictrum thalictroides TaxID=46969 RepID=A0A7J6WLF9_THATH|nr:Rik-like protein [Thalictrum thalictroides]
MTEDNCPKLSQESMATTATTTTSTTTRQRKKRKWDQPDESFISAGFAVAGVLPGLVAPGIASLPGATFTNPVPVMTQDFPAPLVNQTTATMFQKPKIQDELIAREIVINDAESTLRYKLTKRQTQEEIQRCTGAVVITRGKYRPPNALPDSEKPLYLHISAGSHLKETAERIIAVDRAAAMVEEMLKQGQNLHSTTSVNIGGQGIQPLTVCVFLGFDTDQSSNIASRIRGPNDQYVNHIMNETGATVVLRGRGSGNSESVVGEDLQQPLHLFLSGNNPKSLEDAKCLAENLLDTIAAECGASRVASSKVYKAVPPPPQLLNEVQSSGVDRSALVASMASPTLGSALVNPVLPTTLPGVNVVIPQVAVPSPGGLLGYGQASGCGTSYSGYGGIYPQATPLQQVALVLRQSPSFGTSVTDPATSAGTYSAEVISSFSTTTDKRPPQKRKFQELPVSSKKPAEPHQNSLQMSEFVKPGPPFEEFNSRTTASMPPPKKLIQPSSKGMPPPPPRTIPPPPSRIMPPPSKLISSSLLSEADKGTPRSIKSRSDHVPDTLIKLMEYGDDDDDPEEEPQGNNARTVNLPKPFWAL